MYLFGIRGNVVPYNLEFGGCWSVVFEIFKGKKVSREKIPDKVNR